MNEVSMKKIFYLFLLILVNFVSLNYIVSLGFINIKNDLIGQLAFFIIIITVMTFHFTMRYINDDVIKVKDMIRSFYIRHK